MMREMDEYKNELEEKGVVGEMVVDRGGRVIGDLQEIVSLLDIKLKQVVAAKLEWACFVLVQYFSMSNT